MPSKFPPPLIPSSSTTSALLSNTQGGLEGEEELFSEDDDEPPSSPPTRPIHPPRRENESVGEGDGDQGISELRPKKKPRRLKNPSISSINSPDQPAPQISTKPDEEGLIVNPAKPKIKSNNLFWKRPPPPPAPSAPLSGISTGSSTGRHNDYSNCTFTDQELNLPPLTCPSINDPVVQSLGISVTLPPTLNSEENYINNKPFIYTRSDLIRYRQGKYPNFGESLSDKDKENYSYRGITIAQGAWKKWEEIGGLPKGLSGLIPCSYDRKGNIYKPDLTHVQAIRLVIAASPRGRMTLSQIYQAFEERWPWHKTAGSTWKNSIRHNLSLNDCFVNIEKAHAQGGGKGGYWMVDNSLSGRTARKLKRSAPNSSSTSDQGLQSSFSSPIKPTFAQSQSNSRSNSTSNTSSALSKTPNVQVFSSPPFSASIPTPSRVGFGQSSNSLVNEIRNASSSSSSTSANPMDPSNTSGSSRKKIAKPATPYPYILPKRDPSWIPNEVVTSSREIGISRPVFDTPLDRLGKSSLGSSVGEGRTSEIPGHSRSNSGNISITTISDKGDRDDRNINQTSGKRFVAPLPYIFTTRAGIPELPMVEPKPKSKPKQDANTARSIRRQETEEKGENESVLPNLIKAVYEKNDLIEDDKIVLPPVRGYVDDKSEEEEGEEEEPS